MLLTQLFSLIILKKILKLYGFKRKVESKLIVNLDTLNEKKNYSKEMRIGLWILT